MTYLRAIALLMLAALALPALAASVSITPGTASAGSEFFVPVSIDLGSEKANALEGAIDVPEGLAIESIDTNGSALTLFPNPPSYVLADHRIEFTGGTPGSITGDGRLLFTLRLRADAPGTYTLRPSEFSLYRADGKGTRVAIATAPVVVDVGVAGSAAPSTPPAPVSHAPVALTAQIGSDPSLFDGKYFAAFYGGDLGSGVAYYSIQEGWWGRAIRRAAPVDLYYVLADQSRSSSVYITAVNRDGSKVVTLIPAEHPWPERAALLAFFLVLMGLGYALVRWLMRRYP